MQEGQETNLEGKLWNREPGGAAQDPPQGGAQLRHAYWIRGRRIVGAVKGGIGGCLNVQVHNVIPAVPAQLISVKRHHSAGACGTV